MRRTRPIAARNCAPKPPPGSDGLRRGWGNDLLPDAVRDGQQVSRLWEVVREREHLMLRESPAGNVLPYGGYTGARAEDGEMSEPVDWMDWIERAKVELGKSDHQTDYGAMTVFIAIAVELRRIADSMLLERQAISPADWDTNYGPARGHLNECTPRNPKPSECPHPVHQRRRPV